MKLIPKFIISLAIPLAVGACGAFFTQGALSDWYVKLNKPSFNPPNAVFGPVWTVLYILMGIAFFLVWRAHDQHYYYSKRQAMIFYFIQLGFNLAWSFLFFYLQQPAWALIDIAILWLLIFWTMLLFSKVSVWGAWLLVPYLLWVAFATLLNYNIWELN